MVLIFIVLLEERNNENLCCIKSIIRGPCDCLGNVSKQCSPGAAEAHSHLDTLSTPFP